MTLAKLVELELQLSEFLQEENEARNLSYTDMVNTGRTLQIIRNKIQHAKTR